MIDLQHLPLQIYDSQPLDDLPIISIDFNVTVASYCYNIEANAALKTKAVTLNLQEL